MASTEPPATTAATRLVVLLGHPVAHSLSPQLHSAAFAAAGIDAVYVAADVHPDDLPGPSRACGRSGSWARTSRCRTSARSGTWSTG
jgi:hypothetical protein